MTRNHWNTIYEKADPTRLGWYAFELSLSLRLIDRCDLDPDDLILDVGTGASTLLRSLLGRGFRNLVAVDQSTRALELSAEQLGRSEAGLVRWVVDDLTNSIEVVRLSGVKLWHDRAVLHFLTSQHEKEAYRTLLTSVLAPGGFVIIAVFSMTGARMCSGLRVDNYDVETLSEFLGQSFELTASSDFTHTTPDGEARPYVYTLYQYLGTSTCD